MPFEDGPCYTRKNDAGDPYVTCAGSKKRKAAMAKKKAKVKFVKPKPKAAAKPVRKKIKVNRKKKATKASK